MTKRFWIFVTFAGGLLAIAGLILTIVLTIETGQEVDDSECDSMAPVATAEVLQATCVTSDDPKVLLGIIPLLAGLGIGGVGIWRWIAAANETSGSSSDGDGGGGLMGSLKKPPGPGAGTPGSGDAVDRHDERGHPATVATTRHHTTEPACAARARRDLTVSPGERQAKRSTAPIAAIATTTIPCAPATSLASCQVWSRISLRSSDARPATSARS